MERIAIVILNYLNYKDTIECIESIKNDTYLEKEIIVVDNCSNNESWEVLSKKYNKKDKIYLIKSDENLGFAGGNNLGIEFARNKLNSEFVLLVNNDTIFEDNEMLTKLIDAYEPMVGVIGPRIIESNGLEQNPVPVVVDKEKIQNDYNILTNNKVKNNKIYKAIKNIDFLRNLKNKLLNKNEKAKSYLTNNISDPVMSEELVLHGACMMLTKDYFKYYNILFPSTFLYYEENILTLLTKKVGLKKKYINNTYIYHKEDQSSIMSFNNANNIKVKYELESMKMCLDLFDLSYEEIRNKYFNRM